MVCFYVGLFPIIQLYPCAGVWARHSYFIWRWEGACLLDWITSEGRTAPFRSQQSALLPRRFLDQLLLLAENRFLWRPDRVRERGCVIPLLPEISQVATTMGKYKLKARNIALLRLCEKISKHTVWMYKYKLTNISVIFSDEEWNLEVTLRRGTQCRVTEFGLTWCMLWGKRTKDDCIVGNRVGVDSALCQQSKGSLGSLPGRLQSKDTALWATEQRLILHPGQQSSGSFCILGNRA
jgi:hypothetical protein